MANASDSADVVRCTLPIPDLPTAEIGGSAFIIVGIDNPEGYFNVELLEMLCKIP